MGRNSKPTHTPVRCPCSSQLMPPTWQHHIGHSCVWPVLCNGCMISSAWMMTGIAAAVAVCAAAQSRRGELPRTARHDAKLARAGEHRATSNGTATCALASRVDSSLKRTAHSITDSAAKRYHVAPRRRGATRRRPARWRSRKIHRHLGDSAHMHTVREDMTCASKASVNEGAISQCIGFST